MGCAQAKTGTDGQKSAQVTSAREGVRREVHEETGITVTVERLTGVYKNMPRGIVALVFRCTPTTDTIAAGPEAANVRWMSFAEVAAAMDQANAIRVHDAFQSVVQTRAHDGINLIAK